MPGACWVGWCPQIPVHLELQNATLLGKRVFARVISEDEVSLEQAIGPGLAPSQEEEGHRDARREEDHEETEADLAATGMGTGLAQTLPQGLWRNRLCPHIRRRCSAAPFVALPVAALGDGCRARGSADRPGEAQEGRYAAEDRLSSAA